MFTCGLSCVSVSCFHWEGGIYNDRYKEGTTECSPFVVHLTSRITSFLFPTRLSIHNLAPFFLLTKPLSPFGFIAIFHHHHHHHLSHQPAQHRYPGRLHWTGLDRPPIPTSISSPTVLINRRIGANLILTGFLSLIFCLVFRLLPLPLLLDLSALSLLAGFCVAHLFSPLAL